METWTRLYEKATESEHLTDVLDRDPEAFVLFVLMMAKAGVWGRFPGNPKLLKARVAPLSERLTPKRIAELLPLLEEPPPGERAGLVQRYVDDRGLACLAITNHMLYNSRQQWHRVGAPEFPPPPGFEPPGPLCLYLEKVARGVYRDKTFADECARFRLRPEVVQRGGNAPPQAELPLASETAKPIDETPAPAPEAPPEAPTPESEPKKRQRRSRAADDQAAVHTGLYDALEAAYPNYRDARLRGLLAVYLGLLSQPGCTVNEAQLVAALKREPPLAGSPPDKYMLHVQSMFREAGGDDETPARPQFTPEQLAEMEEKQAAKVGAQLQEARLQRLAEFGIPPEVDEWWIEAQRLLRERETWSVGLSMCWLQSVAGGVATLLVPGRARSRVASLEGEIVAALAEILGGPVRLEVQNLAGSGAPAGREENLRVEAVEQARAYVEDCEAYADDPEALADALKEMFGPDLARVAAQEVTGAADCSED